LFKLALRQYAAEQTAIWFANPQNDWRPFWRCTGGADQATTFIVWDQILSEVAGLIAMLIQLVEAPRHGFAHLENFVTKTEDTRTFMHRNSLGSMTWLMLVTT